MGLRATLVATALMAAAALPISAQELRIDPAPGVYGRAIALAPPVASSGEAWLFRFSEEDPWLRFDRPLELDAFQGESRFYALSLKSSAQGQPEQVFHYTLDRRPPEAPRIAPADGSVHAELRLSFGAEPGARVFYRISGSEAPLLYDPEAPPRISAPADGTLSILVSAWAQDTAGNAGPPAFASYLLSPETAPSPEPPAPVRAPGIERKAVTGLPLPSLSMAGEGRVRIALPKPPEGSAWVAGIEPPEALRGLEGFVVWPPDTAPSFDVPLTRGWKRALMLRYGLLQGSRVDLAPPFAIKAAPEAPAPAPLPPPDPTIVAGPDGSLILAWPPLAGELLVSVDGAPERRWQAPEAILPRAGFDSSTLTFRIIASDGSSSETRTLDLRFAAKPQRPRARGVSQGGVYGEEVRVRAESDGVIRYALASDAGMPPEIDERAPLLDRELVLSGAPGKTVRYALRLRAFGSDATRSDETLLSFVVDREPPPVPRLLDADQSSFSELDRQIAFAPDEASIMVSVILEGGPDSGYKPYTEPFLLEGSDAEARLYRVRAYAVDAAGNRSAEMRPLNVLIDRGSIYAAAWGRDDARGTPDAPLASLSAAVARAQANGKHTVRVGGDIPLGAPFSVRGDLSIEGGFTREWGLASGRSRIDSGRHLGSLITVEGVALSISALDFTSDAAGSIVYLDVEAGSLRLRDVGSALQARGEVFFLRANDASVEIENASLSFNKAIVARGLAMVGGTLRLKALRLDYAPAVQDASAVELAGVDASLEDLTLLSSASRNFSGFSVSGGELRISRVDLRASGGSGTCAPFAFERLHYEMDNSYAMVVWNLAFPMLRSEDATGRLSHLSFRMNSRNGEAPLLELLSSRLRIENSIFQNLGQARSFVASDAELSETELVNNCLWGYSLFLQGPKPKATLAELNAPGSGSIGNFLEKPETTFSGTSKGRPVLSPMSACIDAAAASDASLRPDIDGDPRERGAADIGADEYRK